MIPLRLTARLEPSGLTARLRNDTEQPVRVWEPHNSWGGASWSLHLVPADEAREWVLRPNKQPYTANVPRVVEVPPHRECDVALTPGDPSWTFGEDLSALRDVAVRARVVLDIAPSDEATRQRVATGRVESAEVTSEQPHAWLLGDAP